MLEVQRKMKLALQEVEWEEVGLALSAAQPQVIELDHGVEWEREGAAAFVENTSTHAHSRTIEGRMLFPLSTELFTGLWVWLLKSRLVLFFYRVCRLKMRCFSFSLQQHGRGKKDWAAAQLLSSPFHRQYLHNY